MFLFHKHNKSLKVVNPQVTPRLLESPSVSGTLATEEDILSFTIPSVITKPIITFPANNSINYENNISFTLYKTMDEYTGVHTSTEVQVALDNTFENIVINKTYPANNLGTLRVPVDISNVTVYIRVRYKSNNYLSPWSEPLKVKTKQFKINIPTIVTPINNSTGIPKNIVITTSNFSYVGVEDVHDSTTYQVAKDIGFNNIVYNTTSTTSLKSIIASLAEGTTYYIRVRHTGKKYGTSAWSSTFKVSTIVPINLLAGYQICASRHPDLYQSSYYQAAGTRFGFNQHAIPVAYNLWGSNILYTFREHGRGWHTPPIPVLSAADISKVSVQLVVTDYGATYYGMSKANISIGSNAYHNPVRLTDFYFDLIRHISGRRIRHPAASGSLLFYYDGQYAFSTYFFVLAG